MAGHASRLDVRNWGDLALTTEPLLDAPTEDLNSAAPSLLFLLAITCAVMLAGAMAALYGLHFTPHFGIDDANITHIYARNIAQGFGYVFNRGGEHVEGSTSPLWTAVNTVVFLVPGPKPWELLALSTLTTAATVFFSLVLATDLAGVFKVEKRLAAVVSAILLASTPTFFAWNVWSLLDIAPWCLECMLLVLVASRLARQSTAASLAQGAALTLLAVAATVTRPEAIVIVGFVLLMTAAWVALGRTDGWKRLLVMFAVAIAASVAASLLLTLWREAYFGYPLPNTYYAKVSSNHLAALAPGIAYIIRAASKMPVFLLGFAAWLVLAISLLRAGAGVPLRERLYSLAPMVPLLAMAAAVLGVTILEGGDHFSDQRFLQPLTPLLAMGMGICGLWLVHRYWAGAARHRVALASLVAILGVLFFATTALWYRHYQASIEREFVISNRGRAFGAILNDVVQKEGPASVGVIAAGGLPMVFHGKAYDLEGLNWVAMAHANPIKVGPQDHASFDAATFYAAHPDFIVLDYYSFAPSQRWVVGAFHVQALKGVLLEKKFQAEYSPVLVDIDGKTIGVIASDDWIAHAKTKAFKVLPWSDLTFLTQL